MPNRLSAETRTTKTRSSLNRLRKEGKVPGIVYGKSVTENIAVAVKENDLMRLMQTNPNAIIDLSIDGDGETRPVLIKDWQRDKINGNILHVDFQAVAMNEPVKAKVRLEIEGEAPGVKNEGGVMQIQRAEIEVRCLPQDLPGHVPVDVSGLRIGDSIFARDLNLPQGVELETDPDELIVSVTVSQKADDAGADEEPVEAKA